jgi:Secretion system C-terminal sorting domain/Pregnancy-associated plasma protein-A
MGKPLLLILLSFLFLNVHAQKRCSIDDYTKSQLTENPLLQKQLDEVKRFTNEKLNTDPVSARTALVPEIIKVPVVVHVLYRTPEENIPVQAINDMLAALNRDFRKYNSDTINTPVAFKHLSADMGFEFKLATSDPRGIGTSGIIKKYTPIKYWLSDDKMKFSSSFGDDAWDSKSYLNIWICNMKDVLGYSTLPGFDAKKDGIVISIEDFYNPHGSTPGLNDNRTIVHEVGHWLNLHHLWGDTYCGDDGIDDTPRQSTYTPGCPSGVRVSCSDTATGDMYMNYMDFTSDVCMNMFTKGQRRMARTLFETGGPRNSILKSKGLNKSTVQSAALPDFHPKWLHAQVYPNPANTSINVYFEYDERWDGIDLMIFDMTGKTVLKRKINSKVMNIDISSLSPGVYFVKAEKEGERINTKFVKY